MSVRCYLKLIALICYFYDFYIKMTTLLLKMGHTLEKQSNEIKKNLLNTLLKLFLCNKNENSLICDI